MGFERWFDCRRPVGGVLLAMAIAGCAASGGGSGAGGGAGAAGGAGGAGGSGTGGVLLGGSGGSGTGGIDACLSDTFGAEAAPATLLFQVDSSGSMNCAPNASGCATAPPGPGSRWEVFRAELESALGVLPSSASAGLMHYPTGTGTFQGNPTGCIPQTPDVPIGSIATTEAQIVSALAAISPAGGTPTHDGINVALAQLAQANTPGNKFLVLATDGQATFCAGCDLFCTSDELAADNEVLIDEVAAAAASGVRTFVLGAPGSEAYRTVLSRLAEAGDTKADAACSANGPVYCHYDMTTSADFGAALADALAAIGSTVLSCVYDIPPQDGSFDASLVNVELTSGGQTSTLARDESHTDGWDYSDDGLQIILYGPACDAAKAAQNGSVTILYGCPTIVN